MFEDLDGRIDAVLEGGAAEVGVESTVVDVTVWPMVVYRPGAVTVGMIEGVCGLGSVEVYVAPVFSGEDAGREGLPSPGVGMRHYAPRARLVLVSGEGWAAGVAAEVAAGGAVGVMLPEGWDGGGAAAVFAWGEWGDGEGLARRVFAGLRWLDEAGVAVIVCPVPGVGGIGAAVRDRLEKAARVG